MSISRLDPHRATVVSLTSAALEADGRALRFACSLQRAGFRTLVVEGVPSKRPVDVGIPIVSIDTRAPQPTNGGPQGDAPASGSLLARIRTALRAGTEQDRVNWLLGRLYRCGFRWKYGLAAMAKVPRADLYILHGFQFHPVVALRGGGSRVPYIYDAHDCYSAIRAEHSMSAFERSQVAPFLLEAERRCCARAAEVTTVSEGVAELMLDRFGRRPKILRNVQDLRIEDGGAGDDNCVDIRRALALRADDVLVVVIGNCKPGMAVEVLLRAVTKVERSIHVAFVGAGYERYQPLAEHLGIGGNAHFPGAVSPTRVVPFVRSADAAAMIYLPITANYRAALPNGFFQSVQAGLPVLVGKDLPEVVVLVRCYGLGIEVDPADVDDVAHALRRIATDAPLRAASRAGAAAAAGRLDWRHEEGDFLDIVHTALAR